MNKKAQAIKGSCLCEAVTFEVNNDFTRFYQCHCKQCQQMTGTAFASNIFTSPSNINWLSGKDNIVTYQHPTRSFTKSFCKHCGCGLPFVTKSGKALIIPAGSLIDPIDIIPNANIFKSEQASWLHEGSTVQAFDEFPDA